MCRSEGGSSLEDGQLELMVHRQDRFLVQVVVECIVEIFVNIMPIVNIRIRKLERESQREKEKERKRERGPSFHLNEKQLRALKGKTHF